jgi:hypothetical protein
VSNCSNRHFLTAKVAFFDGNLIGSCAGPSQTELEVATYAMVRFVVADIDYQVGRERTVYTLGTNAIASPCVTETRPMPWSRKIQTVLPSQVRTKRKRSPLHRRRVVWNADPARGDMNAWCGTGGSVIQDHCSARPVGRQGVSRLGALRGTLKLRPGDLLERSGHQPPAHVVNARE